MNKKISTRTRIKIRTFHRIASSIVGIQLAFWIISGIYFSMVPIDTVRGKDVTTKPDKADPIPRESLFPIRDLELEHSDILSVQLENTAYLDGPSYFVKTTSDEWVFDAKTGKKRLPQSPAKVAARALKDYRDDQSNIAVISTRLIESHPPEEYRGQLPVYQVTMNDSRVTRLYIDPITGEILSRRNHYWRVYDALWRLHILDFDEGENFNNNPLRLLALSAFAILATGYVLFFWSPSFAKLTKRLRLSASSNH